MNPDIALTELRESIYMHNIHGSWVDTDELARMVARLDLHVSSGGPLPAAWKRQETR